MSDLLVITPTRGRPDRAHRLASAMSRTCTMKTDLVLCFDDDDPTAFDCMELVTKYGVKIMHGSRQALGPWTNQAAQAEFGNYGAYASLGDDHVPRTLGWDAECLQALEGMGGGFVAPNGILSPGFPEACVISAPIVEALGWMALPGLDHWWIDQVWYDLGRRSQYTWLERVMVEHRQDPSDATGTEAWSSMDHDRVVYASWLLEAYGADVETVRKAVGADG